MTWSKGTGSEGTVASRSTGSEGTVTSEGTVIGEGGGAGGGVVRLAALRDTPLSADEVLAAVADPAAGGIALFLGVVREHDAGKGVDLLSYSAHPTAQQTLEAVLAGVAADHDVVALAATHRVGDLAVGDVATVVAASAVHRAEAFTAARAAIDRLKAEVPIWKHQVFDDGQEEWVGSPG